MMTKIEIFSDVVWLWCYIGKRNLEKALQILNKKEEKFESTQNWRSFFPIKSSVKGRWNFASGLYYQ